MRYGLIGVFILGFTIHAAAQPPLNKRDQQRKAEFEAQIAAEEKYDELLSAADLAFKNKDYVKARMTYNDAIQYSPENEQWLISKVNDLDILMAKIIAREVDSVLLIDGRQISPFENNLAKTEPVIEGREEPIVMAVQKIELEPAPKPEVEVPKDADKPAESAVIKPIPTAPKPEAKKEETKVKEDYSKYPQGLSEEVFEFPDHTVTRIIVKDGIDTIVYKYVTHRWGGKFHFKDDVSVSERIWNEEVQGFRKKYPPQSSDE